MMGRADSYNWKRLCPWSSRSCKKAWDLIRSLRENLNGPLLRARCSPKTADWTTVRQPKLVLAIVPDPQRKPFAKRALEIELEEKTSTQAPAKRKPTLRKGARRDATDLFKE